MVSDRLAAVARDLVDLLRKQPEPGLRALAVRMAELADARNHVADHRLDAALAKLRAGDAGDTEARARLGQLVGELDNAAWDLQDRVRAGSARHQEYALAFARARAVSTIWFALDEDPLTAATEAAYEAQAAVGDLALIRKEIMSAVLARN